MKTLVLCVVAVGLIAVLTGCSSASFNVEALAGIKKVAVVGASMSPLRGNEATESNHKVLREVLAESADVLAEELEKACGWKVHRVDDLRKSEAFKGTLAKLYANETYSFMNNYHHKGTLYAEGLSNIPRSYTYSTNTHAAVVAARNALKQMCTDLDVDGVIIVYVAMFAGNKTGFRFSGGAKRTYGYIKYNPLMSMMDKNGEFVFSVGSSNLDDLAPSKHRVPIYKGASTSNYQLDLAHDHVRKAYVALEKKTFQKLAAKVKKNLPQ